MTFIAYPDSSRAGLARFTEALTMPGAKVLRGYQGPPIQFVVECEDREAFARAAGTESRPITTETAPRPRVYPDAQRERRRK